MSEHIITERAERSHRVATCSCGWEGRVLLGVEPERLVRMIAAHHAAQDTEGRYEARVEEGQGLVLSGRVGIVKTLSPIVVWVPVTGKETTAWRGQGWDGHSAQLRKRLMTQARDKVKVLANYLKLNGRRWETVVDEEKREKETAKRRADAAKRRVELAGPQLLKALKAMLANPRPADGSEVATWQKRYKAYEAAWSEAEAAVRAAEEVQHG